MTARGRFWRGRFDSAGRLRTTEARRWGEMIAADVRARREQLSPDTATAQAVSPPRGGDRPTPPVAAVLPPTEPTP